MKGRCQKYLAVGVSDQILAPRIARYCITISIKAITANYSMKQGILIQVFLQEGHPATVMNIPTPALGYTMALSQGGPVVHIGTCFALYLSVQAKTKGTDQIYVKIKLSRDERQRGQPCPTSYLGFFMVRSLVRVQAG